MDFEVQEVALEKEDAAQVSEDSEPRHERELDKHGLRPVWTAWDGYPGEVPDDVREWLDDSGCRGGYTRIWARELLTKRY